MQPRTVVRGAQAGGYRACRWLAALLLLLSTAAAAVEERPLLAVIIDDLGFRLAEDLAVLELDQRVSVAIIPNAPMARRLAVMAREQQRTVLVHLPLAQGLAGECDAPLCPRREWSAERMRRHLAWAFDEVEGAAGLNNHQGSLFTADLGATRRLLEGLQLLSRGQDSPPFIIDSRTSPYSRLAELAGASGFRSARRDVFLDHDRAPEAMERAWQAGLAIARRQGRAIVIGHPHPETIKFLQRALPALSDAGVSLVPVSEVLREPEQLATRIGYPATGAAYRSPMAPSGP